MRGVFDLSDVEATERREQHLERTAKRAIDANARAFALGYVSALDYPDAAAWREHYQEKLCRPGIAWSAGSSARSFPEAGSSDS